MVHLASRTFLPLILSLVAWMPAAATPFEEAADLYRQSKWQESADRFVAYADNLDDNRATRWAANFYAGECYMQLGDYRAARQRFLTVLATTNEEVVCRRAQFRLGEIAFATGNLKHGEELMRQFVDENFSDSLSANALAYLGQMAFSKGDYAQALSTFEQLQESFPDSDQVPRARLSAAWALLKLQRYDEIREQVSWLVSDPRWSVDAHHVLGMAAYETKKWTRAVKRLARAASGASQHPRREAIKFYLTKSRAEVANSFRAAEVDPVDEGAGLQRDGRFNAALAAYRQQLDGSIKGPIESRLRREALERMAALHLQLAQYREARLRYIQLLEQYPDSKAAPAAWSALGRIHDQSGEIGEAANCFELLHEKFPQSAQAPEAAYWLALHAADENDSVAAQRYADEVIVGLAESDDDRSRELWGKAICLKCQLAAQEEQWQQIDDLLASNAERFDEGPLRARVEFWLAEAAFQTSKFDQARRRFDELRPRVVGIGESWVAVVPLRLAQLAAKRQQWTAVLSLVEQVDREFPEFELNYEVSYLRGRAHAGQGDMPLAREAYLQVLENSAAAETETLVRAEWRIGETYFRQRDFDRAREAYQQVMQRHSRPQWQARAALQTGKCWEMEGRWDQAQEVYSSALKQWQDTESAMQLQARLDWANRQTTQRR